MYSEEALESRNKDFKTYRRRFTRKSRRENTNRDLLTRMLLTSDPFLSSIRKAPEGMEGGGVQCASLSSLPNRVAQ